MHTMLFVQNIFFVLMPNTSYLENFRPRIQHEESLKKILTYFPHVQNENAAITPHPYSYSRAGAVCKTHSPSYARQQ